MTVLPPSVCILFFIASIGICSEDNEQDNYVPRVVNGKPGKLGDVPYQIAFKMMVSRSGNKYMTFCGGSIIGPSKVLTAAHCFGSTTFSKCCSKGTVSTSRLSRVMAVAGNLYNEAKFGSDSLRNGQWRRMNSMVYPRNFRFPRADIAVGRTRSPFIFNVNIAPIPYASRFIDYKGPCLASGYGRLTQAGSGSMERAEVLMLAELTIVPVRQCSRLHRINMLHFVCTDIYDTDVSKGDSGGPLVCFKTGDPNEGPKGILVGVVSGAKIRVGTFFTRVSSFPKFIASRGTSFKHNNVMIFLYSIYGIRVLFLFCFN